MSRPKNTEVTFIAVIERARKASFSVKSDFARANAAVVAACASEAYITTREAAGLFVRQWMVTPKGLDHLARFQGMLR